MATQDLSELDRGWNCRLTTRGRKSGEPRTVTIWYAVDGGTLYLTGGKDVPQWCRNLRVNPDVTVEVQGRVLRGRARVVEDPEQAERIRDLFPRKYLLARLSRPFGGYTRSIPVAVEIETGAPSPG
jgi:deazaflavin-dependent oxidoreductase (nitroreductase family)